MRFVVNVFNFKCRAFEMTVGGVNKHSLFVNVIEEVRVGVSERTKTVPEQNCMMSL